MKTRLVKGLGVAGLALGILAVAGCGDKDKSSEASPAASGHSDAEHASAASDASFREYPIGEEKEVEGLKIAAIYLQPVVMEPADKAGLSADKSDIHLEADISALEGNKVGFGAGEFVPYLTVNYKVTDKSGATKLEGAFMPMNAGDGAHYGANVKMPEAGQYKLTFSIESPLKKDYLLHVDKATGVEGRFWTAPIVVDYDFDWVPRKF